MKALQLPLLYIVVFSEVCVSGDKVFVILCTDTHLKMDEMPILIPANWRDDDWKGIQDKFLCSNRLEG